MSQKEFLVMAGLGLFLSLYGGGIWRFRAPYEKGERWWDYRSGVDVGAPLICIMGLIGLITGP